MLRNWKKLLFAAVMLAMVPWVNGFTLLTPGGAEGIAIKNWQLPAQNSTWFIGYNFAGDIGSPSDLLSAYRWNTPVITYAFDEDFIRFFGKDGMKAVDDAMRILNDLPAATKMSDDLSEFPLSSSHLNFEAAQLGLIDLKSVALQTMMEEIGLGDPIRFNYAIRHRQPVPGTTFGVYSIIKFNYDPVTLRSSSYINGSLWTYEIIEAPVPRISYLQPDPAVFGNGELNFPVAGGVDPALPAVPILASGYYYTGLTRDDVGGIRFLLNPRNIVAETLLAGTVPGGGAWNPFVGTNFSTNVVIIGTNNPASAGLRGGVNKLHFRKVFFDSLLGQAFTPININSSDTVIIGNGQTVKQTVRRTVALPDIIFTVQDTYPAAFGARTTTAGWLNNDAINGTTLLGGPGVITPPIAITFNTQNPILINQTPFFITPPSITDTNSRLLGIIGPTWASFDGSTNAPIIYPEYLHYTIQDVRNAARQINNP
jgi:hypothetical protein